MTPCIVRADSLVLAARGRLSGVIIVTGASFDLDPDRAHDAVADCVVAAAYLERRPVIWFMDSDGRQHRQSVRVARINRQSVVTVVGDSGEPIHRQRLRAACRRAGGVAEMSAAWSAVTEWVRVRDVAEVLSGGRLNDFRVRIEAVGLNGLVVIESLNLDSATDRRSSLDVIESLDDCLVLLVDSRVGLADAEPPKSSSVAA